MEEHVAKIQDDPSLSPITWLCISDVTDGHAIEGVKDGRALDADGREVLILVVSKKFESKSLIQRQRMINNVLFEDLKSGILHSVRMKCLTPDQWEKRGKPQVFRPGAPCSISNHRIETSSDEAKYDEEDDDRQYLNSKSVPPTSFCVCGEHPM